MTADTFDVYTGNSNPELARNICRYLNKDLGRAEVVALPEEETNRRWQETTPQWPIMHAVLYGVSRDQMMARHKANHIQVVYADGPKKADAALLAKAAMAHAMGIEVSLCGTRKNGKTWD